ncbi:MAG: cytochrome P450 [Hyphomicrobiaceae bacterium]
MTQLSSTHDAPAPACPADGPGAHYRPFDHAGMYAFFARVRPETPAFFCPGINYWVITRRADILPILRDAQRYSAAIAMSPVQPLPPAALAYLQREGYGVEATQVSCDPPKHTRIRAFAGQLLSQKRFMAIEPAVREIVIRFCRRLEGRGRVDMVADFAYELPAHVIFQILGIPDRDTPKIKAWADDRLLFTFGALDEAAQLRAAARMVDYWRYCVALVEDRKRTPRDDYASHLLAFRNGDDARLTENEIASLVFGLLLAGHETTTNMTSNALHALLSHRDQWERLVREPALIANAVEETLRFASSVVCWRRRALVDVDIGGIAIPQGSNILLALGSANHDEAHFDTPERLDITRANARDHVSFGHGLHFCLGAPLARLELRIILEELTRRFPDMHLVDDQPLDMIRTIAFRGPHTLWVTLKETRA